MKFLRVRNWDRWQTFRQDRPAPPWIKLYRNLLADFEFNALSDSERGQWVVILLLAANNNGRVVDDPYELQRVGNMSETPDLTRFISLQLLESEGKRRRPRKRLYDTLEKSREETEKSREDPPPVSPPARAGRGTRLPDDWTPPRDWIEWAINEVEASGAKLGQGVAVEALQFKDYWVSKPGKAATKLDWKRTWHNWIRNTIKYAKPKTNGAAPPTGKSRRLQLLIVQGSQAILDEAHRLGITTPGKADDELFALIERGWQRNGDQGRT